MPSSNSSGIWWHFELFGFDRLWRSRPTSVAFLGRDFQRNGSNLTPSSPTQNISKNDQLVSGDRLHYSSGDMTEISQLVESFDSLLSECLPHHRHTHNKGCCSGNDLWLIVPKWWTFPPFCSSKILAKPKKKSESNLCLQPYIEVPFWWSQTPFRLQRDEVRDETWISRGCDSTVGCHKMPQTFQGEPWCWLCHFLRSSCPSLQIRPSGVDDPMLPKNCGHFLCKSA